MCVCSLFISHLSVKWAPWENVTWRRIFKKEPSLFPWNFLLNEKEKYPPRARILIASDVSRLLRTVKETLWEPYDQLSAEIHKQSTEVTNQKTNESENPKLRSTKKVALRDSVISFFLLSFVAVVGLPKKIRSSARRLPGIWITGLDCLSDRINIFWCWIRARTSKLDNPVFLGRFIESLALSVE